MYKNFGNFNWVSIHQSNTNADKSIIISSDNVYIMIGQQHWTMDLE